MTSLHNYKLHSQTFSGVLGDPMVPFGEGTSLTPQSSNLQQHFLDQLEGKLLSRVGKKFKISFQKIIFSILRIFLCITDIFKNFSIFFQNFQDFFKNIQNFHIISARKARNAIYDFLRFFSGDSRDPLEPFSEEISLLQILSKFKPIIP